MNIIPIKEWYVRSKVEEDADYIYLFTDNAQRTSGNIKIDRNSFYYKTFISTVLRTDLFHGNSTQAVIRGLDNAFPITTMIDGHRTQWNDQLLDRYKNIIDFEIRLIQLKYNNYKGIKYNNSMEFGNANISKMKHNAPKCWDYLNEKLLKIGIKNN